MSDLLGIGASGVLAYRTALSVVGDNIVNAETPGYARRKVTLTESAASSGTIPLYRSRVQFGGVEPSSISRAWDEFKAADSRLAAGVAGRADARMRWLSTVETALDDGATGVGQSVTAMFGAATTLAGDPGNAFSRRAFLAAIDDAAGAFRTTADGLRRVADGIAGEARTTVDAANATIRSLSALNVALRRAGAGTPAHAQLSDERDRLLDDLSATLEIDVKLGADGTAGVTLARSGGLALVDGSGAPPANLSVIEAADGRLAVLLTDDDDNAIAVHPVSGTLAGLVEAAATVAARRTQLDALATRFADTLNDWSAAGRDTAGAAGTDLLAVDPLDPAATLRLTPADRDPATVPAATSVLNGDGTTTVTANGNLLALATLRATEGTERGWATMVATQSQTLASARSEEATAAARRDGAFAARDDIAGVDLDQEASELLRFQQAYNGSAKIIQVARETLQTIMDIT